MIGGLMDKNNYNNKRRYGVYLNKNMVLFKSFLKFPITLNKIHNCKVFSSIRKS